MNNNTILNNTAILTAIWEETKKDNIELLKPMILFLVGNNTKIGNVIDCEKIISLMNEQFSFKELPMAVLFKVFNRLKGKINKVNKEYYLICDVTKELEEFKNKEDIIRNESEQVIKELAKFLRESDNKFKNIDRSQTEKLFAIFLEQNGFITLKNTRGLEDNLFKDKTHICFHISKFVLKHHEDNSKIFDYISRITLGYMLANAIYFQVENDNNETLKKLEIYLDAPFILNVLGYKTREQNNSAKKLIDLLKEKKAKIKCFKHNYEELYNIIAKYRESLKNGNHLEGKTLEGLNLQGYSLSDVDRILGNLKKLVNNEGIEIVDTPDYKKDNGYVEVIGELEFETFLNENYNKKDKDNEKKVERMIQSDVKTIASIARLRGGDKPEKLEESKAIFVTINYDLITLTNSYFNVKKFNEIGYLINDIELITVLWLKTYKSNPDLPKIKLVENARLSLEMTDQIKYTFFNVVEKLKKEGLINDGDVLDNIQISNYNNKESALNDIMTDINGNVENINEEFVLGVFSKKSDVLKNQLTQKEEELKIIKIENELLKKQKEIEEEKARKKFKDISKLWANCLKYILILIICIIIIGLGIYICLQDIKDVLNKETNINLKSICKICFGIILIIVMALDFLIPKSKYLLKHINKWSSKLENFLYTKMLKRHTLK